jgi:monoamine oxidase
MREQLAMRAPMGAVVKVQAVYEEPFWRHAGLNGQLVADRGAVRLTFDDSPEDGSRGVLLGFVAGNECRRLDLIPEDERRRTVLDELVQAFGPKAAAPIDMVEQRWCAERYTAGGPVAVFSPGLLSGCGPALRAPVGPVHWAGTETATRWCGYIDGAISSGERAADEVIAALGR